MKTNVGVVFGGLQDVSLLFRMVVSTLCIKATSTICRKVAIWPTILL